VSWDDVVVRESMAITNGGEGERVREKKKAEKKE